MTQRNIYTLYRVFLVGLQNFVRNSWLSVAATAVVVIAISVVLAGVILNAVFQNITNELSQDIRIPIYLHRQVPPAALENLQQELVGHESVVAVIYVSPEEARKQLEENNPDDLTLIQGIALAEAADSQFLPASFEVSVNDLDNLQAVIAFAESPQFDSIVESVKLRTDAQGTIERAISIQNGLIRVSVVISTVLLVVAILIIFNTISMTIFARREEIQIMRLVGAPSFFIREPFLVEAGLYGVFGGLTAASLIYGLIWFFSDKIISAPELVESYVYFAQDRNIIFLVFGIAAIGGILISTMSCGLALRRHLKL